MAEMAIFSIILITYNSKEALSLKDRVFILLNNATEKIKKEHNTIKKYYTK